MSPDKIEVGKFYTVYNSDRYVYVAEKLTNPDRWKTITITVSGTGIFIEVLIRSENGNCAGIEVLKTISRKDGNLPRLYEFLSEIKSKLASKVKEIMDANPVLDELAAVFGVEKW